NEGGEKQRRERGELQVGRRTRRHCRGPCRCRRRFDEPAQRNLLDTVYTFPSHPLSSTAHNDIEALLEQARSIIEDLNEGAQSEAQLRMTNVPLVISDWAFAFFLARIVYPNE
ncbi:hypothetical protein PMAYCL1PPCAC_00302, partial [Pristionchus mayeri]